MLDVDKVEFTDNMIDTRLVSKALPRGKEALAGMTVINTLCRNDGVYQSLADDDGNIYCVLFAVGQVTRILPNPIIHALTAMLLGLITEQDYNNLTARNKKLEYEAGLKQAAAEHKKLVKQYGLEALLNYR